MESRNGRLRVTPEEAATDPRLVLLGASRFGQPTPPDGFLYLLSPFDSRPWETFAHGGFVQKAAALPPGFVTVYGERPTGDAATTDLRGLQQYWDQQLGLWRDAAAPDWASAEMQAKASVEFQAIGMGRLFPYRLTNGYEAVAFPDADKRACETLLPVVFELPARLVYELGQQGAAIYQWQLKQAGVEVPKDQQVGFFGGPRITHAG